MHTCSFAQQCWALQKVHLKGSGLDCSASSARAPGAFLSMQHIHCWACLAVMGDAGMWKGTSLLCAGALAGKAEPVAAVRSMHNVLGGTIDPHAAFLMLRGMKTLDVRVQRQNQVRYHMSHNK